MTQMPQHPGITTSRQEELIPTEGVGEGGGHRAPRGSLFKPSFPNVLEGEGQELEPGPAVEFILELDPV